MYKKVSKNKFPVREPNQIFNHLMKEGSFTQLVDEYDALNTKNKFLALQQLKDYIFSLLDKSERPPIHLIRFYINHSDDKQFFDELCDKLVFNEKGKRENEYIANLIILFEENNIDTQRLREMLV